MKPPVLIASLGIIVLAGMAFINPKAKAPSSFEGIITYTITDENPLVKKMNKGSTFKVYIKSGKSKTVYSNANYSNTIITDNNHPGEKIVLMEKDGGKYQIKDCPDVKSKNLSVIKYTGEQKIIAGYVCDKAEISLTINDTNTMHEDVYCAEDISSCTNYDEFRGLKGYPLEWSLKGGTYTQTTTAASVVVQSVSDNEFVVP